MCLLGTMIPEHVNPVRQLMVPLRQPTETVIENLAAASLVRITLYCLSCAGLETLWMSCRNGKCPLSTNMLLEGDREWGKYLFC